MWGGIDHQERNKYKFPGVCPGGGIMHNHITPGVGVEVLKSCRVFLTFSELLRASLCNILISSFAHQMDFAHNFSVDFF